MHQSLSQDRIYAAVDLMIVTVRDGRLELLLSQRTAPPCQGRWALPGRFIGLTESAETTVEKLMEEMLPITGYYAEQLYTFTAPDRDPRGRVISSVYLVVVPSGKLAETMAARQTSFRRFSCSADGPALRLDDGEERSLTATDLGFDHGDIILMGIRRLRGKIDYTDIGLRFLEDTQRFTLGELQEVFEAVLGAKLDTSNFRRSILNRYEKTGRIEQTSGSGKAARGRPAMQYRLNG